MGITSVLKDRKKKQHDIFLHSAPSRVVGRAHQWNVVLHKCYVSSDVCEVTVLYHSPVLLCYMINTNTNFYDV